MSIFLALTVVGVVTGGLYALTSSGLVVTYTTSGVFNFAHGATGMVAAFLFWQLVVAERWPLPLAFVVIVFLVAPVWGVLVELLLMRRLRGAPPELTMVVSIGLMLSLIGFAATVWPSAEPRIPASLFPGKSVRILGIYVTYHQLLIIAVVAAVAVALRSFLYKTSPGVATRAVVDDADLAALAGIAPTRYSQVGWALGSMLAALAGILIAPLTNLDVGSLTLLVIQGYAAAMLGRLRSLWLTFVGGLLLGLSIAYGIGYLPVGTVLNDVQQTIPVVFFFIFLLLLPQRSLRASRLGLSVLRVPRVPGLRESLAWGVVFLVAVWFVTGALSAANLILVGHSLAFALIALSLVPLVGYAGQPSLCQFTFAGIGAYVAQQFGNGGSLVAPIAAAAIVAVVGAIVALPALRLQGLYLALATLAFAEAMDSAFFNNANVFGTGGAVRFMRFNLPSVSLQDGRSFTMFLAVVFAVLAVLVLALRRSFFGRRLIGMAESPIACASLGLSRSWTRLSVFALSAAIAGLGGALYGEQQLIVTPTDFAYLSSLVVLLLATLGGIRTVSGVLLTAVMLGLFPTLQAHVTWLNDVSYLLTGLAAISLGSHPNGVMGDVAQLRERLLASKLALAFPASRRYVIGLDTVRDQANSEHVG